MTLTHLDLDRIDGLAGRLRESGTKNAPRNSNGVYMSICDEAASDLTAMITRIRELEEALDKLRSYSVDIEAGRINYRPLDHIAVADAALQRKTS